MHKIIDVWDVTGKGDYILTLNDEIPNEVIEGYRIDGKDYPKIPVSLGGRSDVIGTKGDGKTDLIGKEVIFIKSSLPERDRKRSSAVA